MRLNAAKMNKELVKEKRKIKNANVIGVLSEKGIEISENDAEIILEFLYFLAKLTVNQYVNDNYDKGKKS